MKSWYHSRHLHYPGHRRFRWPNSKPQLQQPQVSCWTFWKIVSVSMLHNEMMPSLAISSLFIRFGDNCMSSFGALSCCLSYHLTFLLNRHHKRISQSNENAKRKCYLLACFLFCTMESMQIALRSFARCTAQQLKMGKYFLDLGSRSECYSNIPTDLHHFLFLQLMLIIINN